MSIATEIKLIGMDVDGVLTDGGIYYYSSGNQLTKFNSKDGMAIKILQDFGFYIMFLPGSSNNSIIHRAKSLEVERAYTGIRNKLSVLNRI